MSWITVDTGLVDHPKIAALSTDAARWGWMATLLHAKRQKTPGTFASPQHYRHVLGKLGRYLQEYIDAGLLDEVDGRLDIHDWPEYQRDRTNAERQQRFRDKGVGESSPSRSSNGESNEPHAGAGVVAVPVAVVSSTENKEDARAPDPADVYWTLTGRYPTDKVLSWVDDLSASYGPEAVIRALATTHGLDSSTTTLLGRTRDVLAAEARALSLKEQTTVRQDLKDRRAAAPVRDEAAIRAEILRLMQPGAAA